MILKIIKKGEEGCKKFKGLVSCSKLNNFYTINIAFENNAEDFYLGFGDTLIFEEEEEEDDPESL